MGLNGKLHVSNITIGDVVDTLSRSRSSDPEIMPEFGY